MAKEQESTVQKDDSVQKNDSVQDENSRREEELSRLRRRRKRRLLPPLVMLSAGSIAGVLMLVGDYELHVMMFILLLVLLGFYMLGCILKYVLDRIDIQSEIHALDEGEVIEKEKEPGEPGESEKQESDTAEEGMEK